MGKKARARLEKAKRVARRAEQVPAPRPQLGKRKNQEVLGCEVAPAGQIESLREWLEYQCEKYSELPNDYNHYLERGMELLKHEINCFVRDIRKYHEMFFGSTYEEFMEALCLKETWLFDQIALYYTEMQEIEKMGRATGWSAANNTFLCACHVQMLLTFIDAIVRHIRAGAEVPAARIPDCSLIELRHDAVLNFLVDPNLVLNVADFPELRQKGVILYYTLDGEKDSEMLACIGHLTQYQVMCQLRCIAKAWPDLDLESNELRTLLRALYVRISEFATCVWPRNMEVWHSDVSRPLDMGEKYEIPSRFMGVLPEDMGIQLDLASIMGDTDKGQRYESLVERKKWRNNDLMQPGRAYFGEVVGMEAAFLHDLYVLDQCIKPLLCDDHLREEQEKMLVFRATNIDNVDVIIRDHEQEYDFDRVLMGFQNFMEHERSQVVDEQYKKRLVRTLRTLTLPYGVREEYAYKPKNSFLILAPDNVETIELFGMPRPVWQGCYDEWIQLQLIDFERRTSFPSSSRAFAAFFLMRVIIYNFHENNNIDWLNQAVVHPKDVPSEIMKFSHHYNAATNEYSESAESPFICMLGGNIYIRLRAYTIRAKNAYYAILMWIMSVIVDHKCLLEVNCMMHEQDFWQDIFQAALDAMPPIYRSDSSDGSDDSTGDDSESDADSNQMDAEVLSEMEEME